MVMKMRVGDEVMVITGKDKGKKGKIEVSLPKKAKVVVGGINIYKKHAKPGGKITKGGIIDLTKPLSTSNLLIVCPNCHLPTRVGSDTKEKGKRICRKCQHIF
jgi:large subunit ribosomal protein L24